MLKQKTRFTFIFAAWAAITLFNAAALAQMSAPAKVEIQSLMIRKVFQRTPEGFLTYRTMQGADILFDGRAIAGSPALYGFRRVLVSCIVEHGFAGV